MLNQTVKQYISYAQLNVYGKWSKALYFSFWCFWKNTVYCQMSAVTTRPWLHDLSKPFRVVIQPLSTRLIKPKFLYTIYSYFVKALTIRYTPLWQAQWYLILAGFSERKKKKPCWVGKFHQVVPSCQVTVLPFSNIHKSTISSCVSVRMSRYWARGKFNLESTKEA